MVVLFELQGYTGCRLRVDYGNGDILNVGPVSGPTYIFDPSDFGRDTLDGIYTFECDDNCSFSKVITENCVTSGGTGNGGNGDCDCFDENDLNDLERRVLILEGQTSNVNGVVQFTKFKRGIDPNTIGVPPSLKNTFDISGEGWFDNPDDTSANGQVGGLFAVTSTLNLNDPGTVSGWSNPLRYEGADGRKYKELFIFIRSAVTPSRPTGGSYNFATDQFTTPNNWSSTPSGAQGVGNIYVSSGYATGESDEIDSFIEWSEPVKFNGDDGTSLNIIYRRSETMPPTPNNTPKDLPLPNGWSETAYGDQSEGRLWASVGYLYTNAVEWVWDTPYAAEGLDGKDGTDFEYIFKLTTGFSRPTEDLTPDGWETDTNYQTADYIPLGWFDDAQEVTAQNKFQWFSTRKRINGVWQPFGPIRLWNQFATEGSEGKRYKELFIFRYDRPDITLAAPSGGAYNFDNDTLETPNTPDQWWDKSTQAKQNTELPAGTEGTLYISTGTASGYSTPENGSVRDAFITWSDPVEFSGLPGSLVNLVYTRTTDPNGPETPANTPKNDPNTVEDESIPPGWADDPDGLNIDDGPIWASYGYLNPGEPEWVWDSPYKLEGLDGRDGTDIEFIFIRTQSLNHRPETDSILPFDWAQSGSTYQNVQEFITQIDTTNIEFGVSPNNYTSTWTDDPIDVDELFTHQWFTRRERKLGVWNPWTPVSLWNNYSNDGINGLQYRELFIYRKFTSDNEVVTPSGGSYNFDSNSTNPGLTPPANWFEDPKTADDALGNGLVYVSTGYASTEVSNIDDQIQWSRPFPFVGGEGGSINVIYIRDNTDDGPEKPDPTPPDVSGSPLNDSIPNGWFDEAIDATGDGPLWMSLGQLNPNKNNGMWVWGDPIKAEPLDGPGIEFIFINTKDETDVPANPTPDDYQTNPNYQANDFDGEEFIGFISGITIDFGTYTTNWTDNPTDLSENLQIGWVSTRRYDGERWGPFSNPSIRARWAKDGRDGLTFEKIFILTPNLTDKPLNPTPSGDVVNGFTYLEEGHPYQEIDYIPPVTPEGFVWTDNPFDTSEEFKYQWFAERKLVDGVWQPYNQPSLWSRWGRDGDTEEFIYMLTRDNNDRPTVDLITPSDWDDPSSDYQTNKEYITFIDTEVIYTFRSGTDQEYDTAWTDEAQDVFAPTFRAQWYTKRTKSDGVWGQWERPKLWTMYGEDGERIEYIYTLTKDRLDVPANPTPIDWDDPNSEYQADTDNDREYVNNLPSSIDITGATSGNVYSYTWLDDPSSISEEFPVQWYCHRRRVGGQWTRYTEPIVWTQIGGVGPEGKGYKELFIYKKFTSNQNIETPSGGSFNFELETISLSSAFDKTTLTSGWTENLSDIVGQPGQVYVSYGYAKGKSDEIDELIEWSIPVLFTGPPGTLVNLIFTRSINKPDRPENTFEDIEGTLGVDESIPSGWTNDILDVGGDAEQGRIWQSFGFKEPGDNFWVWREPVPAEPLDGEDGNGVEYIYRLGKSLDQPPVIPDTYYDTLTDGLTGATYQTDDFVPSGSTLLESPDGDINEFWSDNIQDVSAEYPVQWISQRRYRKILNPNTNMLTINRYWDKFETPRLNNRFNSDGRSYRELFIFKSFDLNIDPDSYYNVNDGEPATPSGGTYNFQTNVFDPSTMNQSGWTQSNDLSGDVYFTSGYAFGTTTSADESIEWNRPRKFTAGKGTILNIVYKRAPQDVMPDTPDNIPASGSTRLIPNGWSDSPIEASGNTDNALWASVGYLQPDSQFWTFDEPYIAEPLIPKDGPGREFIFILTTDDTQVPPISHPSDYLEPNSAYQEDEFLPTNVVDGQLWQDDALDVTQEFKILWMSTRKRNSEGVWLQFGTPKIVSRYVKDGKAYRELFIYQRSISQPSIPTGGSYDFTDNTFVIPDGWFSDIKSAISGNTEGDIYISTAFAEGDSFGTDSVDTTIIWSEPQIFTGRDGSLLNLIYKRSETQPVTPDDQPVDTLNRKNPQIPSTWFDSPSAASGDTGQLWESKGILDPSSDFWVYGEPISVEGATGADGKDYEFIFTVTDTNDRPQNPTPAGDILNDPLYQLNEYIPTGTIEAWTDDPQDVTATSPYQWASRRVKLNGFWTEFSTPKLWNKFAFDGPEGRAYKEIFIYTTHTSINDSLPPLPTTGGTYNFNTDTLQPPTANWFRSIDEARLNSLTGDIYVATTTAVGFSDTTDENLVWSTPIKFTGDPGTVLELIFKRFDDNDTTQTTAADVINDLPDVGLPIDPLNRNVIPISNLNGWVNDATQVTPVEGTKLWSVIAYLEPNKSRWRFKSAVKAEGADGADGKDGSSIEQIFIRTKSIAHIPTITYNATSPEYQNNDEYFPFISGDTYSYVVSGVSYTTQWTDDPLTVNNDWKYQLVSIRRKVNGVWGSFSEPVLWSTFASDGEKGSDGGDGMAYKELFLYAKFPEGTQPSTVTGGSYTFGINGPSGDTMTMPNGWYRNIAGILNSACQDDVNGSCRTYMITGTAVGKPGETDPNIEWSTPARIDTQPGAVNIIYIEDETLVGPSAPSITTIQNPIPSGWSDTIPSATTENGRIWASYGINPPESSNWIWGQPYVLEGKDGISFEYIYKLTSGSTRPATPFSDPNIDNYLPDATWFDEQQDVNDIDRYQWVSQRKKLRNGTWGDYSIPKIWNRYLENGITIELTNDVATYGVNLLSDSVPNSVDTPLSTDIIVYDGTIDVTSDYTISIESENGITGTIDTNNGRPRYRVTSMGSVSSGTARISASANGINVVKDFKVTKVLNGSPGTTYKVFADQNIIKLDNTGVPQTTQLIVNTQTIQSISDGQGGFNTTVSQFPSGIVKVLVDGSQLGGDLTGSPSYNVTLPSSFSRITLQLYLQDGVTLVDTENINTVSDGQDGIGSFSLLLSNDGDTIGITSVEFEDQIINAINRPELSSITTTASIYQGDQIITTPTASGWTFDIVDRVGVTGGTITPVNEGAVINGITAITTATAGGSFVVRATNVGGSSFRKTFKIRAVQDVPAFFQIKLITTSIPTNNDGLPKINTVDLRAGQLSGNELIPDQGLSINYSIDGGNTFITLPSSPTTDYSIPTVGVTDKIDIKLMYDLDGVNTVVVDEQSVYTVRDGDKGDDSTIYYIRPVNGTVIRNGSGTVELEVIQVVGNNEIVLTSGDVSMVDTSTNNPISSLPDTTGDDYNITIGPNAITNGRLDVGLVSGGTILDSITIADLTDGLPAAYVESTGLVFKNVAGDDNITPTSTTLTAYFGKIGTSPMTKTVNITPSLTLDGNPQLRYTEGGNININVNAVNSNGQAVGEGVTTNTSSLSFTFTYDDGGEVRSVSETVFFVSDGKVGEPGPQGVPGVSASVIVLTADKQVLRTDENGTFIDSSVTLTANTQNTQGSIVWTNNRGVTFTANGNNVTFNTSNFGSNDSITFTASVQDSQGDTISDSITLTKIKEGSSTVNAILSNESAIIVATEDENGDITAQSLVGTGTGLSVYQGAQKLTYRGQGSILGVDPAGSWRLTSRTVSPSSAFSLAPVSSSGGDMLVGDATSANLTNTNGITITYGIQYRSIDGNTVNDITKTQTFSISVQPPQKYTWIKYADDENGSGISDSPVGKDYIGLAYDKLTPTESVNPSDYDWSKFKGEDGVSGQSGTSTWIKFAPNGNPTSGQMTNVPQANTTHIGIAPGKTDPNESDDPTDYTWSKYVGDDGLPSAEAQEISADVEGNPPGSPSLLFGGTTTQPYLDFISARNGTILEGIDTWVVGDIIVDTSNETVAPNSDLTFRDTQYMWNGKDWTISTMRTTSSGIIVDSLFTNRLAANQAFIKELLTQKIVVSGPGNAPLTSGSDTGIEYIGSGGVFDLGLTSTSNRPFITMTEGSNSQNSISSNHILVKGTGTSYRSSNLQWSANWSSVWVGNVVNGNVPDSLTMDVYDTGVRLRGKHNNVEFLLVNKDTFTYSGTITADDFALPSDIKLKENITNIENPLEKVLGLNGVMFDWKKDGKHDTGLIAQEVEQVMPEVIYTDDKGNKTVSYPKLVGLLVEAIKELNDKIQK